MSDQKDPLFPALPEDLKSLKDDEVQKLLDDHVSAAALIDSDDEEFLAGLTGDEVIAQYTVGVEQIKTLQAENKERLEAFEQYKAEKERLKAELNADSGDENDAKADDEQADAEADEQAEEDDKTEVEVEVKSEEEPVVEVLEPVTASVPAQRFSRTPPAPARERIVVETVEKKGNALVAAGEMGLQYREPLNEQSLANLVLDAASHHGVHPKTDSPGKYRFGGPEHKIAHADFEFPEERTLTGDLDNDAQKVKAQIPALSMPSFGKATQENGALTASGGICAPSTPFYGMVNFATEAEPVWDSLPVFRAARGGVNVPTSTYIADITTAITFIDESEDAQGGTFATKSCQALDCPPYTETFVGIQAHCREYGNLNARTWPEKIAHENALTMAALARTSEDFMLERIKALSINVTNGVETLGALIYLVDAIVKARFGIAGRFRMPANARFRALLPAYAVDLLILDTIQTQFDRFKTRGELTEYLRGLGIDVTYYIDGNFAAGDDQLPDAAQTAAAIDGLPNTMQWALYPDGAFLGIDAGSLELGIVRDSVLNSTNDFQVFGERFRNLVRLAPAQAAYWITTDWCPSGQFPPAGTARTCE